MVISEEDLLYRLQARDPGKQIKEASKMKVQNFWLVIARNRRQVPARLQDTVFYTCVNAKRGIRHIEEAPHFFSWFRQKAEHTLPTAFAKLKRQLSRKGLGPSDATRFNSKY